jgi:hypothetical protein
MMPRRRLDVSGGGADEGEGGESDEKKSVFHATKVV